MRQNSFRQRKSIAGVPLGRWAASLGFSVEGRAHVGQGVPWPVIQIARVSFSAVKLSWGAQPRRVVSVQRRDGQLTSKTVGVANVDRFADDIAGRRTG